MPLPHVAAGILSNRDLAVSAAMFPADRLVVSGSGLYSWWVDEEGRRVLEEALGEELPELIYAGQAGATSVRSGKASTATLGSRILTNHIRGTAYGSTFRKSISALLLGPLGLKVDKPDHLVWEDNNRVTAWIRQHLSVVVYPYDDRESLGSFEDEVLRILNPPLNLHGMSPTAVRTRLSTLRRKVSRPMLEPAITEPAVGPVEIGGALAMSQDLEPGEVRFMIPTGGPEDWRRLLADPDLHWVVGRSARTLAHAWEDAAGWPPEIGVALGQVPELAGLGPVYGFPEFKTPLPGGRRASQTDLMVIATDGTKRATVAIEGKVDEPFGRIVNIWLGADPSPGKRRRLEYLAGRLGVSAEGLGSIRYQLVHRAASAKIETQRNGSEIAMMLVHSWAPNLEGFADFRAFAGVVGVHIEPGEVRFSHTAGLWLGWISGDPKYLTY